MYMNAAVVFSGAGLYCYVLLCIIMYGYVLLCTVMYRPSPSTFPSPNTLSSASTWETPGVFFYRMAGRLSGRQAAWLDGLAGWLASLSGWAD